MSEAPLSLVQGTLDLLVLRALESESRHGYGVTEWLRRRSGGALSIEEGALYTCLHRMERRGWLAATWGLSENKRRAKFYRLTAAGRRQLDAESHRFRRYCAAVFDVLGPAPQPEAG